MKIFSKNCPHYISYDTPGRGVHSRNYDIQRWFCQGTFYVQISPTILKWNIPFVLLIQTDFLVWEGSNIFLWYKLMAIMHRSSQIVYKIILNRSSLLLHQAVYLIFILVNVWFCQSRETLIVVKLVLASTWMIK